MKKAMIFILTALVIVSSALSAGAVTLLDTGDWLLYRLPDGNSFEAYLYQGSDAAVTVIDSLAEMPVVSVGDNVFTSNSAIVSFDGGDKITKIGEHSFADCASLSSVTLPATVVSIGASCFVNDAALTDINLGDTSIAAVPGFCFSCSGVVDITLPETCESVGYSAFQRCGELVKIVIPSSVTEIAENAFEGCGKLVIYTTTGSFAAEYAIAHEIPYVLTDATQPARIILGDSDGDGEVTILDATAIQRTLAGLPVGRYVEQAADADHDGGVSILDATSIQRFLAGLSTYAGVGKIIE